MGLRVRTLSPSNDNDPSNTVLDEVPVTRATRAGFASLDRVDLMTMFRSRACIMKSPPHFL